MLVVESFVFSPFYENTFVVYDDSKECAIIDPGCYTQAERDKLKRFIENKGLTPVLLLNTHCHIDHVFGNRFVAETWKLELAIPDGEQPVLESMARVAQMYAIPNIQQSPDPEVLFAEGDFFSFGNTKMRVISAPGHSPAGACFYFEPEKIIIVGDVLFEDSIGRTDLPGGDYDTLINNIKTKLLVLPDDVIVYNGHGNSTSIGREKKYNPFLTQIRH
jgi:glyoxylase-like metal-dependent hydrolase (beta-lactamase superfamily II)